MKDNKFREAEGKFSVPNTQHYTQKSVLRDGNFGLQDYWIRYEFKE